MRNHLHRRNTALRVASVIVALGSIGGALVLAGSSRLFSSSPPLASLIDNLDVRPGHIVTVAGGAPLPEAAIARSVALLGLCGVAVDQQSGAVYFSDTARHLVGRVDPADGTIRLLAGTGAAGYDGDGRRGRETSLHVPCQIALHPATGEVVFADTHNYRVRAVTPDGTRVRTVAGAGVKGHDDRFLPTEAPLGPGLAFGRFSGDGGPATAAELNLPAGVAFDRLGNLYIGDAGNHRVRVINMQAEAARIAGVMVPAGAIQTIAGLGTFGFAGDGGPAIAAKLAYPKNLAVDPQGSIYVTDSLNGRLRRIDGRTGTISTVARSIPQKNPLNMIGVEGVAAGPGGEIYYSDLNGHAVFRLNPRTGARELVAGVGAAGFTADGGAPLRSRISAPAGLAIGPDGAVHFVETANNRLRRATEAGLQTVAGGGSPGEGIDARSAAFSVLAPIAVDPAGDLYIADANLHSVRRVDARTGIIRNFAGTGVPGFPSIGADPAATPFVEPSCAFLPGDRDVFYLKDPAAGIIRRVRRTAEGLRLEHFAGSGKFGRDGDGGPATEAAFSVPLGFTRHPATGDWYVATVWMPTIRKIDRHGTITTVAGTGNEGYAGDGGPAAGASFHWPTTISFDASGNLYIVDFFNSRIRVITPDGTIRTFAGTGQKGFSGDGGPASEAQLNNPNDLVIDAEGNFYVTDVNNHRIRKIDGRPPHRIQTIAGTGVRGFSGDGGLATDAQLNLPRMLALSPDSRVLYVTDSFNGRVRAMRLR